MNVELLKDAYQILAGIPAKRFVRDLRMLVTDNSCGTLACGIGWLALYPHAPFDALEYRHWGLAFHRDTMDFDMAAKLFFELPSTKSSVRLFGIRQHSKYDKEMGAGDLSDKALLLYRIRRELGEQRSIALAAAKKDSA